MLNSQILSIIGLLFAVTFIIAVGFTMIKNLWRRAFVLIPAFMIGFLVFAIRLHIDFIPVFTIEALTIIIGVLYAFGVLRVVMFVVPHEHLHTNKKKKHALMLIIAILLAGYLYGYLVLFRLNLIAEGVFVIVFGAAASVLILYLAVRAVYYLLSVCVSVEQQYYMDSVSHFWVHTPSGKGGGYRRVIIFMNDHNEYSVTPSVFNELIDNSGHTYQYTVITGLGGIQFVRDIKLLHANHTNTATSQTQS